MTVQRPKHFESPRAFARWLAAHYASATELWVGYYKKATGKPSMTWPESVDEALCYGWIDGIRKSVDADSYMIRFTPRRADSHWSAVNIRRARLLVRQGRMKPSGLRAFRKRRSDRTAQDAYENPAVELPPGYIKKIKANKKAWSFYQSRPPGYRRTTARWVMSARQEKTRLRRLAILISDSADRRPIGPLARRSRPT